MKRMLTLREAAELLHVHPNTARKLINDGRLRAYRVRRKFRIAEHDLLAALEPVEAPPVDRCVLPLTPEARMAPSARRAYELEMARKG